VTAAATAETVVIGIGAAIETVVIGIVTETGTEIGADRGTAIGIASVDLAAIEIGGLALAVARGDEGGSAVRKVSVPLLLGRAGDFPVVV